MNNHNTTGNQQQNDAYNRWSNMANTVRTPETPTEKASRQQRKIIAVLATGGEKAYLGQRDVQITDEHVDYALNQINNGNITDQDLRGITAAIVGPDRKPNGHSNIYGNITKDPIECQILAYATGADANRWQDVGIGNVQNFLTEHPEPADFDKSAKEMLDQIRTNYPDSYNSFAQSMNNFRHNVYGKKQEYWDQINVIKNAAEQRKQYERSERIAHRQEKLLAPINAVKDAVTNVAGAIREFGSNAVDAIREKFENPEKRLSKEYLKNATIDGDPWVINGQNYQVTPEIYEQFGLGPRHEVKFDGAEIALSDVYEIGGGRNAVVAYVKDEDGSVKMRSYYRSNSQGVWRYLPDYTCRQTNGPDRAGVGWYGKSANEDALNLPGTLQKELNKLSRNGAKKIEKTDPAWLFSGTACQYSSKQEYSARLSNGTMRGDFYREVNQRPTLDYGHVSRDKLPPANFDITGPQTPDFQNETDSYIMNSNIYGQADVHCFDSADGQIRYSMCEVTMTNGEVQSWVGNAEMKHSKITSTGLRAEWASTGDLGTPLYEYASQDGGYGDQNNRIGSYVNMWNGYLARTPLIRRYMAARHPNQQLPR